MLLGTLCANEIPNLWSWKWENIYFLDSSMKKVNYINCQIRFNALRLSLEQCISYGCRL